MILRLRQRSDRPLPRWIPRPAIRDLSSTKKTFSSTDLRGHPSPNLVYLPDMMASVNHVKAPPLQWTQWAKDEVAHGSRVLSELRCSLVQSPVQLPKVLFHECQKLGSGLWGAAVVRHHRIRCATPTREVPNVQHQEGHASVPKARLGSGRPPLFEPLSQNLPCGLIRQREVLNDLLYAPLAGRCGLGLDGIQPVYAPGEFLCKLRKLHIHSLPNLQDGQPCNQPSLT